MTAPHADQLIDGYLSRLRAASAELPRSAREELLADMQSHIAEARARESEETDATILNILDRLGEPQAVVAEARDRLGPRPEAAYRPGLIEIAAVVLLPLVWIVGVILLWLSPAWKVRDKIVGSIFSLGGYPALLFVGSIAALQATSVTVQSSGCVFPTDSSGSVVEVCSTPAASTGTGSTVLWTIVVAILWLLPLATSLYLVARLSWRRSREATLA